MCAAEYTEHMLKGREGSPLLDAAGRHVSCHILPPQDFLPPYEHFWERFSQTDFTQNRAK
jgi:hypothetical protein